MSMNILSWVRHNPAAMSRLRRRSRRTVRIKPSRPSRANELWYKAELINLVRYIAKVTNDELLPLLKRDAVFEHEWIAGDAPLDRPSRLDFSKAYSPPINTKAERLTRRIEIGNARRNPTRPLPASVNSKLEQLSRRFGNVNLTAKRLSRIAVQRNLAATDSQLIKHTKQALGIDIAPILQSEEIRGPLLAAEAANIDLIQSIPEKYLEKAKYKLEQNYATGSRWEDLADALEDAEEVTVSRAKLIARDQTSKMNGAFNKIRQTSIGIMKYRWQTAGDERVRPTHHDNDGKVFEWNNPPTETGNPGEDINCRCVAIPEFDLDDEE